MDGISQAIAIRSIIRVCLPMAAHTVKKPVQTLHKIYPTAVQIFQITLS